MELILNKKLIEKLIRKARQYQEEYLPGKMFHITYIVEKNNIVGQGTNKEKTHPFAKFFLTRNRSFVHSEMDAIIRLKVKKENLYEETKGKILVNLRLSKDGKLKMAKPCSCCLELLSLCHFSHVYYSSEGIIEILY